MEKGRLAEAHFQWEALMYGQDFIKSVYIYIKSFLWDALERAAGRWAVSVSNAFKPPNVPKQFDKVLCKYLPIWREKK